MTCSVTETVAACKGGGFTGGIVDVVHVRGDECHSIANLSVGNNVGLIGARLMS